MTDISNNDDIIDSRDVIERIEELETECIHYVTGCLSDSEPAGFTDFDDAKRHILDTLQQEVDQLSDNSWMHDDDREKTERVAEEIESIIQDINLESGEFSVFVPALNCWYWVAENPDEPLPADPDDAAELEALRELAKQAEGYAADWRYGEALIRDSYFKEYAQQLAEDIGAIDRNAVWPNTCIDWDQAADDLKMDYTCVEFDGVDYWIR